MLGIGAAAVGVLYLASGFYQIEPGARGVVTTFGDFASLTDPGLNWHVPWPVQAVEKVDVQEDRAVAIGRGSDKVSMLTSDLNIVEVDMQVNYRIKDDADTAPGELPNAAKYVFNIEEPEALVRAAAEAALREVVGGEEFGPIISQGRAIVNDQTADILQSTLDSYQSGIEILRVNFGQADPPEQVIASQRDVVDARSEAEQKVNVATGYASRQVPVAQGQARQTVLDAEAYAARVTAEARGDAARFVDVYDEYVKAPEVTRERLYLETMENVLSRSNKIILDDNGGGGGGAVPLLDVNELAGAARQRRQRAPQDGAQNQQGGN
jgi:membrane protease subunit HflK